MDGAPTTAQLVAELLKRCSDERRHEFDQVTVAALRRLRNCVVAELDRRYPHLLDG